MKMEESNMKVKSSRELRKKREYENRRKEKINAAEKLYKMKGFDKTTMNQIAKEAGLAKGTTYNYFDTQEDLYLAITTISFKIL